MGRFAIIAAMALLAVPWRAVGQETDGSPPTVSDWIGRWSGSAEVYLPEEGPTGSLTVDISMNEEGWEVDCLLDIDDAPPGGPVLEWKVEREDFSFRQWIGDVEIFVSGKLVDGRLIGEIVPVREGERLGAARFVLRPVDSSP
jgi:hypothetical protein